MASPGENMALTDPAEGVIVSPLMNGLAKLPEALDGLISLSGWADALVNGAKYREPDPDYLSRLLIRQTLEATTPEQVFEPNDLDGLQKLVPNTPGSGTGPIEIDGLYVASSSMDQGHPTYMILEYVSLDTGVRRKTTTGAGQLQSQILSLIGMGIWPIKCQVKRTERKDRGGRFLFWLFPVD